MLVRPFEPMDFNYVISGWLKSYRKSDFAGVISNDIYYATYLHTIESLIKSGADIHVCQDEEGKLLGFICHSVTDDGYAVIHYIYVNKDWRDFDIYHLLQDEVLGITPGFYTFRTKEIYKVLGGWRFAPEIARRK